MTVHCGMKCIFFLGGGKNKKIQYSQKIKQLIPTWSLEFIKPHSMIASIACYALFVNK